MVGDGHLLGCGGLVVPRVLTNLFQGHTENEGYIRVGHLFIHQKVRIIQYNYIDISIIFITVSHSCPFSSFMN